MRRVDFLWIERLVCSKERSLDYPRGLGCYVASWKARLVKRGGAKKDEINMSELLECLIEVLAL